MTAVAACHLVREAGDLVVVKGWLQQAALALPEFRVLVSRLSPVTDLMKAALRVCLSKFAMVSSAGRARRKSGWLSR